MKSRFGRSQRPVRRARLAARRTLVAAWGVRGALHAIMNMGLLLTGCMAFQDVELSTERASVEDEPCEPGKIYCNGKAPRVCVENDWVIQSDCPQVCIRDYGCVDCRPGDTRCTDGKLETCNAMG